MSDNFHQEEVQRAVELAVLREQFLSLNKHVSELETRIKTVDGKLDEVLSKLSEAKGGWRTLMWLGGAGATVGAMLTWLATHTFTIGPR